MYGSTVAVRKSSGVSRKGVLEVLNPDGAVEAPTPQKPFGRFGAIDDFCNAQPRLMNGIRFGR